MSFYHLYELLDFCVSLGLNLIISVIVVRQLQAADLLAMVRSYNLLLFNLFVFLLCYILIRMELSVGAGLGLFALLGILRIRSEVIKIEELIGLLFLMGIGFIHSVYPQVLPLLKILLIDLLLGVLTILYGHATKQMICIRVKVQDLTLLHPDRHDDLCRSLEENLGLRIKKISLLNINMTEHYANLRVTIDCNKTSDRVVQNPGHQSYHDIIRMLPQNGLKKDFIT